MPKKDIFDKIMSLPVFNIFEPFYKEHKELLLYLFFGVLAFGVSIITFALFNVNFGINELMANVFSWIITVTFAFFTNRIWVFSSPTNGVKEFLKQMSSFFGGRLITLLVEEVLLFIFITWLQFPNMIVKIIAQILVIVLNYVISKLFIFSSREM